MRKAIGLDRRRDPQRVLDVLHEIDADVVALQEADKRFGGRGSAVPHELIDSHGMYKPVHLGVRHRRMLEKARQARRAAAQGQHPQHRLARQCDPGEAPRRRDRLRGARAADARAARRGDGRAADRRPAAARRRHAPRSVGPVAQAADARDPRRDRRASAEDADGADGRHQRMADRGRLPAASSSPSSTSRRPGPSFHARHPVAALDRIIVHKDLTIEAAGVHMSAAARRASDHLPIWARLSA